MSPSRSIANASAIRFFGIRHIDFGEQRARTGLERVSNARHLSGKIAAGDFRHADDRANSGSDASCLGFYRQGGGFLIPNSITNSWLATDPKKHVELVTAANKTHNGDLVPLIKMIKGWNKKHSAFFRSFHLEVLALEVLGSHLA
jgi:hypothetical protein